MGKLEETFNLPDAIEDLNKLAKQVSDSFKDDAIIEVDDYLEPMDDDVDLDIIQYEKDMHQFADKMMGEYDDIAAFAKDVEVRHTGEILSAAASLAKHALDARRSVMDAKLKARDLKIRQQKAEAKEDAKTPPIEGQQINRDELLKIAREAKKS